MKRPATFWLAVFGLGLAGYRGPEVAFSDMDPTVQLPASANSAAVAVAWINPDGSPVPVPVTKW